MYTVTVYGNFHMFSVKPHNFSLLTTFDYFFVFFWKRKFSVNFYILISRNRYKIRRWFCLFLTEVPPWGWAKWPKPAKNWIKKSVKLMHHPYACNGLTNFEFESIYRKRKCGKDLKIQGNLLKVIDNKTIRRISRLQPLHKCLFSVTHSLLIDKMV